MSIESVIFIRWREHLKIKRKREREILKTTMTTNTVIICMALYCNVVYACCIYAHTIRVVRLLVFLFQYIRNPPCSIEWALCRFIFLFFGCFAVIHLFYGLTLQFVLNAYKMHVHAHMHIYTRALHWKESERTTRERALTHGIIVLSCSVRFNWNQFYHAPAVRLDTNLFGGSTQCNRKTRGMNKNNNNYNYNGINTEQRFSFIDPGLRILFVYEKWSWINNLMETKYIFSRAIRKVACGRWLKMIKYLSSFGVFILSFSFSPGAIKSNPTRIFVCKCNKLTKKNGTQFGKWYEICKWNYHQDSDQE